MTKIKEIYRSILTLFFIFLFGMGALVISHCIFPFQKRRDDKYKTLIKSWNIFISMLKKTKILELHIDNIEKLKNIKNSIIVSTHPSLLDIVILMIIIPDSTCFVAEKLGRNPFLKGMVKALFIIEGQPMDEWLGESREMIDNGLNIIIFPTGRRHFHDESPRLHRGASLIAYTTKKDIAILKMETSIEFLQIHSPVHRAGSKPVIYDISYIETLNTKELIEKYPDEVTFKTNVTKHITEKLFNKE